MLVRHDDGYLITGTLRDADGQVVGTLHGTLTELTTGFTTCPQLGTASFVVTSHRRAPRQTCNVLGGGVTLNFRGTVYDSFVAGDAIGHSDSGLCRNADTPTTYGLGLYLWSTSHVPPGEFPDIFNVGGTVQQITPTLFKWSS